MHLIVGLGNPGPEYRKNRHNAGFMLVEGLAGMQRGEFRYFAATDSLVCRTRIGGQETLLAKPLTFMNRSGLAVRELAARGNISNRDLLVVYDEAALELGRIRIRPSGSAGGHQGMQSVIDCLGTQEIPRLRIGVGQGPPGREMTDWVLSDFRKSEETDLKEALERASGAVEEFLSNGIESAMALYNMNPPKV